MSYLSYWLGNLYLYVLYSGQWKVVNLNFVVMKDSLKPICFSSESEDEDEDDTDSKPDQGPTIGPEDYTDFQVGG